MPYMLFTKRRSSCVKHHSSFDLVCYISIKGGNFSFKNLQKKGVFVVGVLGNLCAKRAYEICAVSLK